MNPKHCWQTLEVAYLKKTYPHCGTVLFTKKFPNIPLCKVRSKCNKMGLTELPKKERVCIECGCFPQLDRYFLCRSCFNMERKKRRRTYSFSQRSRFLELLRTCRYRSKEPCDLTVEFLELLWQQQGGLCFYSGLPMVFEGYGRGRNPFSLSIDRKDSSRGYKKDNVVLCCWSVNAGKHFMSVEEYVAVCEAVVQHQRKYLDSQPNKE